MTLTFAQEQQVQRAIGLLQKRFRGLSILSINESVIRQAIGKGRTPEQIVTEMFRTVNES